MNNQPANLHTHTTFCDGKNTPEENVIAAIKKNFSCLGFSSHSVYPFWLSSNIKLEDFDSYCAEINRLKKKYENQIIIKLGFEADYIPGFCEPDFQAYRHFHPDFLIGSVHFLYNGESELTENLAQIDSSPTILTNVINNLYNGSARDFVCHYFATEREMLKNCSFTIIAHADLVRKFNDKLQLFNEKEDWYRKEIKETAEFIKRAGVITEINTGAVARGYMKTPYPSQEFLAILRELKVPVTLSSDSHKAENLDFGFDAAVECAKKAGYKEILVPTADDFKSIRI